MIVKDAPSETSPLLPKRTKVIPESAQAPSRIAPDGLVTDGHPEEGTTSIDEEQGQSNGKDRNKEHQGLPQVKKQLRYIVPAVSIGVQSTCLAKRGREAERNRYFFLPVIKHSL